MQEKLVLIIAAVVLHSGFMIFFVNKNTVMEASNAYGKQLIFSCETLMKGTRAPAKSAKAKAAV